MLEAGVIGVKAGWDDTEARAKATAFVAWMRAQMASIGSGVPQTAGGGFFNRVGGGGNLTAAGGAGGGGWGSGGFRPLAFDSEAEQVRGGLRTLARALYGQAMAVGQLNISGGGRMPGIGQPALPGGATPGAPGDVGGGGGLGEGDSVSARMYRRFARSGGAIFAYHAINHLAQQIQTGLHANRGLSYGDIDEALSAQSSAAAGRTQEGIGHLVRQYEIAPKLRMLGLDRLADQYDDDKTEETLRVARLTRDSQHLTDVARENARLTRQGARTHLLSGHRATQAEAANEIENAGVQASKMRDRAKALAPYDYQSAKNLFNQADDIERAAAAKAFSMRWKDREGTDTTMMGLRFDLEEQQMRNRLNPGQAHAMGIAADAAMHVREMLIGSTRENAEYARQIGIAQLKGYELETIMSGNAAPFDPFLQMAGPTSSKNTESVAEILTKIHDEIRILSNSLQDIGQTANPGDGN